MEQLTDIHLMNQVKQGDLDKMGLLFERHHKMLFGFFFNLTHDQTESEDLVQTVFYKIMKYRKNFRGEGKFTSWMFHIARNLFADWLKKNKRETRQQDFGEWENQLTTHSTAQTDLEENEEQKMLRFALTQLSESKREILVMSKLQQMKYEQIAEILDCSVGNVKVKVYRAMQDLKAVFKQIPQ
ncbi:MAG: RNA polymerase sigma factor (sigma-70 family) [Bacteroidia bacterium]